MTQPQIRAANPFASFDLDSLLTSAARLRPDRPALGNSSGLVLDHREFDRRVTRAADQFLSLGLVPGECLLVVAVARAASIAALIGGLRAGLDVALAPPRFGAAELSDYAVQTGAVAFAGEADYGGLAPLDILFEAAATSPRVRLLCGLGGGAGDGAVEIDWKGASAPPAATRRATPREGRVVTFEGGGAARHDQHHIVATALNLLSRARVGMRDPIVSTLAPASHVALAAGPVAALLAGCALHFHGPFSASDFLTSFDAMAPAHLVAPRALADALLAGGADAGAFASLMLTGNRGADGHARPAPGRGDAPFIDLDDLDGAAFAKPASMLETATNRRR